ncbi:MAG TPA: tRNA pseudouridine(38-40) synthase TruA [Blastocatellia bacterium]|nr:tRNA pseudouridine(38-40) synthase TruA [Blastocatellia bacterium]
MNTWKLTIEYEGTRYSGWQEQKNARSVAGEIRVAAEAALSTRVELLGAGRTDAGVHALAQVGRLRGAGRAKPGELLRALNDRLPADINVLKVEEARERFDPRRDAIARYYLYQISTRRTAFAKRFVWWVKDLLDFDSMNRASQLIKGRHDFKEFSERRGDERSTIVVVNHAEMAVEGDLILFRIGASHFLWKMVRRIVGALVEVGRGSLSIEEFDSLINGRALSGKSKLFQVAAHTAPPSGLFLDQVVYNKAERLPALAPAFPVSRFDG